MMMPKMRPYRPILALGVLLVASVAFGVGLVTAVQHPEYGTHLADSEGRTLYLFAEDGEGVSTCVDRCAATWPPLLLSEGEDLDAGPGVAASLLSTIERPDGARQVAYSGIPLYTYVFDDGPGNVRGQGVGDAWFLVSPFGTALLPAVAPEAEAPESDGPSSGTDGFDAELLATLLADGSAVYEQNCAVCHGASGGGVSGPSLAGADLSSDRTVLRRVIYGAGHMPGFGAMLDDDLIASVVSFVRRSWGNDFRPVAPEEVVQFR